MACTPCYTQLSPANETEFNDKIAGSSRWFFFLINKEKEWKNKIKLISRAPQLSCFKYIRSCTQRGRMEEKSTKSKDVCREMKKEHIGKLAEQQTHTSKHAAL